MFTHSLYSLFSADARTLFVKGLADSVDESKLYEFFSGATEIRLPQKDGYHKGYEILFLAFEVIDIVDSKRYYVQE